MTEKGKEDRREKKGLKNARESGRPREKESKGMGKKKTHAHIHARTNTSAHTVSRTNTESSLRVYSLTECAHWFGGLNVVLINRM